MIQNLDYAETILDIAQAPIPEDMQGHSLLPLLKGEAVSDWRDSIYYHYYEYPSTHMVPQHNGIRTERYKLMHFYEFNEWEFYDLKNDPEELHNLYENPKFKALIDAHKLQLEALRKDYGEDSDFSEQSDAWKHKMRQP